MEKLANYRIYIPEKMRAAYEYCGEAGLGEGDEDRVLVGTHYSAMSPGTEKANYLGMHVHGNGNDLFPRSAGGYSGVGEVIAVGANVTGFKPGDRVTYYWGGHYKYQKLRSSALLKVPDDISDHTAAFTFISTFPMAAIRKVKLELGESLLVMGLGTLGQLAVGLAHAGGAVPVIAADPVAERRELALQMGADYALDPLEKGFADKVRELTGRGVNAAVEVTGVGAGLNETLECMAKYGRVALLGCTRDSNFTVNYYDLVHYPGITLVGAHTDARPAVESSANYFTHMDDMKCMLKLCSMKRIDPVKLLKEIHAPSEAPHIYERLAAEKNFPTGLLFDWSK